MKDKNTQEYNVGDFVMFKKFHSQWGHAHGDYHYGVIMDPGQNPRKNGYKWSTKYNICCTDGKKVLVKQNRIIVLAKAKN